MLFKIISRAAGVVLVAAGLAGCVDVTMDIDVLSDTNGKATTTMVMGADFYAMAKQQAGDANAEDGFCNEADAVLTENADGSATCTMTVEGAFADLKTGENEESAKFEVVSPGVVKVSFKTEGMMGEMGADGQDEQTKAMMQGLFEGHNVTIRVKGNQILDTNMTKSGDGKSAEIVIPFLDLINGTATLPPELFATVKTN